MSGYLPRGLPPSTADLTTLRGIAEERRDLERLHQAGLINRVSLEAGLEALATMARMRRRADWERHRQ